MKQLLTTLLFLFVLASCVPAAQPMPATATPIPPPVGTPAPTATGYVIPEATAVMVTATAKTNPTMPGPGPTPTAPAPVSAWNSWIAYTDFTYNLWLVRADGSEQRQLTKNGSQISSARDTVMYQNPAWSPDGKLLAYTQTINMPKPDRMVSETSLWVYDMENKETRLVLAKQDISGFEWRPGTRTITYALPSEMGYFTNRGETDPQHARGIWAIDVDSGGAYELVKPERGYSIRNPHWAKDGSILGFEETLYMEGRGSFAYYDFNTSTYHAWDKAIGGYDWSPTAETIAYDYQLYVPSGTERIHLNNRDGASERPFSPQYPEIYASGPRFSAQGDQLSYTLTPMNESDTAAQLVVQPVDGGDPRVVGSYDQLWLSCWGPDGQSVLAFVGPWEQKKVVRVNIADGSLTELGVGWQATCQ